MDVGSGNRSARDVERPSPAAPLLVIVLLLLGVVAVASAPSGGSEIPGFVSDYAFTAGVVLGLAVGVTVLALFVRHFRLPPVRRRREHSTLLAILVLGAVIVLGTLVVARTPLELEGRANPGSTGGGGAEESDPEGSRATRRSPGFRWEVPLVLGGLTLLVGLGYLLRRTDDAAGSLEEPELSALVARVVDESIDDLRAEPDPRRAVIAAYARMEGALAGRGLARAKAEAPLEYLSRVLARLDLSRSSIAVLTDLFERAKFSARPIDETMRDEAIAALVEMRDELWALA